MIWIWIAAAVIISLIVCNKRIPWYHYIWMLLPIEMYGITIAGATFKPYMIFGILFFLGFISKRDNLKLPVGIGLVAMALLVSDLLNGLILASIMQHLMFLLIIFIAYSYLRLQGNKIELDYIADVTIATTVGYGLVFFAASILFSASITFDGIYTTDRYSPGMIMRFLSTGGISSTRLRGFCIDPNSVFTTLIPGAVFSLANILYLGREKIKSIVAVLLYVIVVYLSGSRMGMVCTALMLVTMFIIGYRETTNRKNWNIVAIMATVIVILLMALRGRNILTGLILEIEEFFSSRASLFDNAGRFTIWKSNFIYLFEQNRIWFGVGQNQISNLTSQGKAFHNTWLEWLSGTGIFIGTGICLWFITAPRVLKRKCYEVEVDYRHYFEPLVLAYWTVLIAVTTVDNITNSVMLFLLVLFRYGIVESSSGSGVTKDFMIRQ